MIELLSITSIYEKVVKVFSKFVEMQTNQVLFPLISLNTSLLVV